MDECMFFAIFLCGDLLRRKKEGKRLTFREKWLFLQVMCAIANNFVKTIENENKARLLAARLESDINISDETICQIVLLVAACKEFKGVPEAQECQQT
jgi:hypothetical protein